MASTMRRCECSICETAFPTFEDAPPPCACGGATTFVPAAVSATVRETIDTGTMARRVETFADVVQLQERRRMSATIK